MFYERKTKNLSWIDLVFKKVLAATVQIVCQFMAGKLANLFTGYIHKTSKKSLVQCSSVAKFGSVFGSSFLLIHLSTSRATVERRIAPKMNP